jgi:hypothetical protein
MSSQDPFEAGRVAGRIDERLAGHDKHFEKINGNLGELVVGLEGVRLAVQRLADQAVSRDATVVTTAAALKDAEDARRLRTDQKWTPVQRFIAVVGTLVALVGTGVGVWASIHH